VDRARGVGFSRVRSWWKTLATQIAPCALRNGLCIGGGRAHGDHLAHACFLDPRLLELSDFLAAARTTSGALFAVTWGVSAGE